jgi:hypothetical protein
MCIDIHGSSLLVVVVEGLAGTASTHRQKPVIFPLELRTYRRVALGIRVALRRIPLRLLRRVVAVQMLASLFLILPVAERESLRLLVGIHCDRCGLWDL